MDILFYDSVILLCNKRGTCSSKRWVDINYSGRFFIFFFISSTTPTLKDARSDKEILFPEK